MGYRIREFCDRYEVNDKNGVWKPGQPLRVGAIDYIRAPVHGKNWTLAFREFNEACGADAPMVYGVFCKLREIQADNVREYRDAIRDHKGRLLEADTIARVLGWPVKSVEKSIKLLSGEVLGWLEEFPGIPGNSECPVSDHNHNKADHKQPSRQKETTPDGGLDGFDEFWAAYPKHENRPDAQKAWKQVKPPVADVVKALNDWQRAAFLSRDSPKYIPAPGPYLRGRRWEDERPGTVNGVKKTQTQIMQEMLDRGEL